MVNENETVDDVVDEITEEQDEEGNDTTKWKELALKNQGIAKRKDTKFAKLQKEFDDYKASNPPQKNAKDAIPEKPEKSNELDYGQRAFLKTYGISGADELALVKSWVERTGDQIDVIVDDEIFNAKLKGLRDQKTAKENLQAMSGGNRNQQQSSKSKVDYWIDKPFEEVPKELRTEVLNAQLKREQEDSKFYDS
jgi:hypothetical protein